jgi:hypothetical protein
MLVEANGPPGEKSPPVERMTVAFLPLSIPGGVMAKTSIVDEIEHHPQFCLDLSDPAWRNQDGQFYRTVW